VQREELMPPTASRQRLNSEAALPMASFHVVSQHNGYWARLMLRRQFATAWKRTTPLVS
jgi:hypothetical protein